MTTTEIWEKLGTVAINDEEVKVEFHKEEMAIWFELPNAGYHVGFDELISVYMTSTLL